jgi:hypothetical protein
MLASILYGNYSYAADPLPIGSASLFARLRQMIGSANEDVSICEIEQKRRSIGRLPRPARREIFEARRCAKVGQAAPKVRCDLTAERLNRFRLLLAHLP